MKKLKILNNYGGLGGNRKLWKGVDVTMTEIQPDIAEVYSTHHPEDNVIITDAHQYLLDHVDEFDAVWSSPPCQGNTKMMRSGRNRRPRYPDLRLYEEAIFLKYNFNGLWVMENVEPYYEPLMQAQKIGRHLFWANFEITPMKEVPHFKAMMTRQNVAAKSALQDWLGIHYDKNIYYGTNHCVTQVLRNCVHPDIGLHVLNCMLNHLKK